MKKGVLGILFLVYNTFVLSGTPDTLKVDLLIQKAILLETNSDFDSTFLVAKEALKLAEHLKYDKGIASAYMRLGSVFNWKGKNDSALFYIQQAYEIRKQRRDYKGATKCCFSLCNVYKQTGKTDKAFQVMYDALRLNKYTGDNADLAEIYIELGNLNVEYGAMKTALDYFLKAEKLAKNNNDIPNLLSAYSGLGNYYFINNNFKTALNYYFKSDTLNTKINNRIALCINYNNIALCYDQLKDVKNATIYYHKALNESIVLGLRYAEANASYNLGSMFNNRNMPDSAIYYLNRSLVIADETDDAKRIADCYEYLSDAYEFKKDFEKALHFHKLSYQLNDSLLNSEKISKIAEMQTKYETEIKEQQIVLLDAQNKTKSAQRNIFVVATLLFLLLAIAILVGLLKTRKEKKISEALLLNILPAEVAEELKQKGSADAQFFDEVTVLFTDFKDFTQITERLTPTELVELLHGCFKAFDDIITKHRVEKIKTIGDSYMCAGGLPVPNKSNANDVVQAGLEIQEYMKTLMEQRVQEGKEPIEMRLGIHTGPVVAGIVGVKKFAYDIWGDTVNTASRMEHSGAIGKVNISETTYELIKDSFICTPRGKIEAKHKGLIEMYFVEGRI